MTRRPHCNAWIAALIALAACGKDKDAASSAEAAPAPGGATPAVAKQPTKAPVKAPERGPERPVFSLVDNRLSAHLTRNGGLLVPAGSAGFAKYVRFGNTMRGAKRTWEL